MSFMDVIWVAVLIGSLVIPICLGVRLGKLRITYATVLGILTGISLALITSMFGGNEYAGAALVCTVFGFTLVTGVIERNNRKIMFDGD